MPLSHPRPLDDQTPPQHVTPVYVLFPIQLTQDASTTSTPLGAQVASSSSRGAPIAGSGFPGGDRGTGDLVGNHHGYVDGIAG